MESDLSQQHHLEDEEEYVVLDLDAVSGHVDIPQNAPYVLTVCSYPYSLNFAAV